MLFVEFLDVLDLLTLFFLEGIFDLLLLSVGAVDLVLDVAVVLGRASHVAQVSVDVLHFVVHFPNGIRESVRRILLFYVSESFSRAAPCLKSGYCCSLSRGDSG